MRPDPHPHQNHTLQNLQCHGGAKNPVCQQRAPSLVIGNSLHYADNYEWFDQTRVWFGGLAFARPKLAMTEI
jgi:hypothetical protein